MTTNLVYNTKATLRQPLVGRKIFSSYLQLSVRVQVWLNFVFHKFWDRKRNQNVISTFIARLKCLSNLETKVQKATKTAAVSTFSTPKSVILIKHFTKFQWFQIFHAEEIFQIIDMDTQKLQNRNEIREQREHTSLKIPKDHDPFYQSPDDNQKNDRR